MSDAHLDEGSAMYLSAIAAVALILAVLIPACLWLYITGGTPVALPPAIATALGVSAWMVNRPRLDVMSSACAARRDALMPLYIGTIVVLIAEHTEQWLGHLPEAVMRTFPAAYHGGIVFDDRLLVSAFPLAGSVLFLFGALALHHRLAIGEGAAWVLCAWALVCGASPFVFALARHEMSYVPGMAMSPLVLGAGIAVLQRLCVMPVIASGSARAVGPEGEHPARFDRETRRSIALVAAFVTCYATLLFLQAGLVPVGIICGAMVAGFVVWIRTTAHRPADPRVVLPPYLLTLSLFLLHVLEEHRFDFAGRISAAAHVRWSEHDFVLLIVLAGPAIWILGAIGLHRRHPLGNYLVWFIFIGMILGEPAHLLVFPFLEGGRYHYFPGMWTALLPMVPATYGAWRVASEHRAAMRGAALVD